ncbi:hypothetical protein BZZ01_31430 [Nostocales cyanobacterium HT-58-2]|nr:hypothetical protein BZZ01_31430 [Nostocales cyanobacterium HT-58-2]
MKHNRALSYPFQLLDEILTQHTASPLSLNPQKTSTTSFVELGHLITEKTCDIQLINSLGCTLERILHAMLYNFPENIFWDFDFIVSSILTQALSAEENALACVESYGDKIVSLMELFGRQSEIRFRYVHDFTYGFDWAKWVHNAAQTRNFVEPFSLTFLDYLLARGQGILQLIYVGDTQYYRLSEKCYRNPFCFSREPEDEYRLLTSLAAQQLIPVASWNWNAQPVWDKPFHQLREQLSLKLNISQNT